MPRGGTVAVILFNNGLLLPLKLGTFLMVLGNKALTLAVFLHGIRLNTTAARRDRHIRDHYILVFIRRFFVPAKIKPPENYGGCCFLFGNAQLFNNPGGLFLNGHRLIGLNLRHFICGHLGNCRSHQQVECPRYRSTPLPALAAIPAPPLRHLRSPRSAPPPAQQVQARPFYVGELPCRSRAVL